MVRRALTLSVPWTRDRREQESTEAGSSSTGPQGGGVSKQRYTNALSSSRFESAASRLDPRSDARPVYMDSRRLSRRVSNSAVASAPSTSRWRRPSFSKKTRHASEDSNIPADRDAQTQSHAPEPTPASAADTRAEVKRLLRARDEDAASDKDSECSRPMKALEDQAQAQAQRQKLASASAVDLRPADISLVPDFLPVQPIQDIPDAEALAFRSKYNLYNPIGPKWYKNHHLIPPHTRMPLSSTFSPAFPPMRSAMAGGSPMDVTLMPGPSRTPSDSPFPTPNASQTRLGDGPVRSRKISQGAHDNVDMLDATDPWGTSWHHQSPYDVGGLNASPAQDPRSHGSRTSSSTRQNGRLPNPSPLSQSTSAIHLADSALSGSIPPRKRTLSKPAGGIRRFFSGNSSDDLAKRDARAASAPATPVDDTAEAAEGQPRRKLSKRQQTAPPAVSTDADAPKSSGIVVTDKKEKRSSIMGRIGKKLSVLRHPLGDHGLSHGNGERRSEEPEPANKRLSMSAFTRNGADSKKLSRRVPPPESKEDGEDLGHRSSASIDLEFPLTMGNLTIANPDQPNSSTASLAKRNSQLPPELAPLLSPTQSMAPLPPPKATPKPPPLTLEDSEYDSDEEEEQPILRVTNTPHRAQSELPFPTASEAPSSPLLPPIRPFANGGSTNPYAGSPVHSPDVVSISLSTASFSSPPPPPEKNWAFVDPATLNDSPEQQDMDLLPDIASEADPDAFVEMSGPRTPRTLRVRPQSSYSLAAAAAEAAAITQSPLPMSMSSGERSRELTNLSRASLFVNPPTPIAPPATMPGLTSPPPPVPAMMSLSQVNEAGLVVGDRERERAAKKESRREEKEKARREERDREVEEQTRREEREREKEREREERMRREEREREREKEKEREREEKMRREEREREREREREERARREEREREREREREERLRNEERELERQREERAKREERERAREREEKARRDEWEREREKERVEKIRREEYEREREREEKARREEREREKERARREEREREERARREEREREEAAAAAARREEQEERTRRDERDRERTLRHERRASRHEDKSKRESIDKDRSSRRERDGHTSTTETFRLVRSASDNMRLMQVNAIPVGEEQWTVVEASPSSKRDKSSRREKERDKEREHDRSSPDKSSRRRESKRDDRHDRHDSSRSHHRHSSTSVSKEDRRKSSVTVTRAPADGSDQHLRHQHSRSLGERRPSDIRTSGKDKDRKSERRRRESRYAGEQHSSDSRTSGENQRPSQSSLAPAGVSNLERHSSLRRAVSDVPAGAEQLMSLSAREVMATERMWKGKSAAFDPDTIGSIHGGSSYDPRASQYSGHSSAAGTIGTLGSVPGPAHAGYMVQHPFYEHGHPSLVHQNSFYAVPVSITPPVVFPAQATYSPGRYDYPNAYRSYTESLSYGDAPGPLMNPLPDPPRQSTYSPEPMLPPNSTRQGAVDDPSTPEFWRQYAGITTH